MITGIAIENFKGIRERVEIELRPITLLFGANSAGKSSIFHALHYAREVFERHNLSPDLTTVGGNAVDLGGFCNFVHGQDKDLPIRLTFQVSTRDWSDFDAVGDLPTIDEFLQLGGFDCFGLCSQVGITIEIRWSETLQRPYVSALHNEVSGSDFLVVTSDFAGRRVELRINSDHPTMTKISAWRSANQDETANDLVQTSDEQQSVLTACLSVFREFCQTTGDGGFFLENSADALLVPRDHSDIPFSLRPFEEFPNLAQLYGVAPRPFISEVNDGIGRFLWPALRDIQDFLAKLRYLGPLREVPSRTYSPPSFPDDSRWASGLGAWDALQNGPDEFVQSVGNWLGDEDKLNSGYRIERRKFKEIDLADPLIVKLLTGRAFDEADDDAKVSLDAIPTHSRLVVVPRGSELGLRPHDVGIGISQIVPVIATALDGEKRIIAIEQPELHIHPRIQANEADLFVEAVATRQHQFLIETHSEHLILRLQRRIRETSQGLNPEGRKLTNDEIAVYYISQEEGQTRVRRIDIDMKGEFVQPWPDDFFEIDFYERFGHAR